MPFNGSGTFQRTFPSGGWQGDAAANIKIKADRHDQHDADLATGLSNVICKDGQSSPTADIPFNGKKITNLAPGVVATDAANVGQLQAIRDFSSAVTISGSSPESVLKFTGSTGPWGLSWPGRGPVNAAGMFFGVKVDDWVWNDKPDGSGNDVMLLSEIGGLKLLTKSDAALGPTLNFEQNSASPAANDIVGITYYSGRNSAAAVKQYGQFYTSINDATSGSEDASMSAAVLVAGAMQPRLALNATGVTGYGTVAATGAITAGASISTPSTVIATNGFEINGPGNGTRISADSSVAIFWGMANGYLIYTKATGNWEFVVNGLASATIAPTTFVVRNTAFKPGGGAWADTSDERIKTVTGDYTSGLDAIKGLRPVRFTFKGNDTKEAPAHIRASEDEPMPEEAVEVPYPNSPHQLAAQEGTEYVGLIAQEVEQVMPGMVSQHAGFIDGAPVDDIRDLDTTNLIYALVNAVKELAAEVEALKAR